MSPLLQQYVEALLFYNVDPMSTEDLAQSLNAGRKEIEEALDALGEESRKRGIRLVREGQEVRLATMPEASGLIEKRQEEDLSRGLGKAGLETLALILYQGPLPKARIDYIRGVNAASVLRTLMTRGLVEKQADPNDARATLYKVTLEALQYLGVENRQDLPNFESIQEAIQVFEKEQKEAPTPIPD